MTEQKFKDPTQLIFIQSRAITNYDLIDEYAEMMKAGIQFDAIQGIQDKNDQIYIWDGLHRGEAARLVGVQLLVNIEPGTRQDAEWLALTANQKHGLRRSRADIQRIIRQALLHPYGVNLSDREIARHCGVDHKTVGKIRQGLELSGEIPQMEQRTVSRNGQTYQQDTRNIGGAKQKRGELTADPSRFSYTVATDLLYSTLASDSDRKTAPGQSGVEPKAQEFQCPRCGQEEIVGINGSRRWCLNCGAEWPTVAAFLEETQARPEFDTRLQTQKQLQDRFLSLLSRLDQEQLMNLDAWLDDLEHQLLLTDGPQDARHETLNSEPGPSFSLNQFTVCPAIPLPLFQMT